MLGLFRVWFSSPLIDRNWCLHHWKFLVHIYSQVTLYNVAKCGSHVNSKAIDEGTILREQFTRRELPRGCQWDRISVPHTKKPITSRLLITRFWDGSLSTPKLARYCPPETRRRIHLNNTWEFGHFGSTVYNSLYSILLRLLLTLKIAFGFFALLRFQSFQLCPT